MAGNLILMILSILSNVFFLQPSTTPGVARMARRYPRQEFLDRLRAEIARGRPLVMTGAGSGVCAKFIERGGVDILGVYNTGYFRMHGHPSLAGMLPIVDSNELVY